MRNSQHHRILLHYIGSLIVFLGTFSSGAFSSVSASTFFADLDVNLVFIPAAPFVLFVNRGAGPDLPACSVATVGSATADCKDPTSNLGIARLNFHAGSVEGLTLMPFGLAAAESHGTSIQAIVANPGPSSVPFQVELFFVGSLLVTAGPSEVASAGYGFTVERNFTTVSAFTQIHRITCPACGVMSITDSPDAIVAPPGGVVSYVIDPFVIGQAVTVPEPSTYLLVATGFGILLGGHRWGRRNPRFVTQRAYPLHFAFHLHASRFRSPI